MKDYYYILGLSQDCTDKDIKTAFRRLSLKYHSDHNEGDRYFEPLLRSVSEAHEELTKNRQAYDVRFKDYVAARSNGYGNQNNNHQKQHYEPPPKPKSYAERAREAMAAKEKERREWIKNNPPPKPFSDPIFKHKY